MIVTILVILLVVALGAIGFYGKKAERLEGELACLRTQNADLQECNDTQARALTDSHAQVVAKETQIEGMLDAVTTACTDIAVAIPSIEGGEWGLVTLVRKLINELDDAQQRIKEQDEQTWSCREALACSGQDDLVARAKTVSNWAAIAGSIADLLGVDTKYGAEAVMVLCTRLAAVQVQQKKVQDMQTETADSIRRLLKWLGARDGESIQQAVNRVILTSEVAPGAATELQKCRAILGIPAGQTVLEALQEPMSFKATVNKRNGNVVGIAVVSEKAWPKVGPVEVTTRDV